MNRKKQILNFAALAVAAILGGNLVSCSGESFTPPSPIIVNGNAVLVTSAGKHRYTYDESGKLTGISNGEETYTLHDGKYSLNADDGRIQMNVFVGSDGLITKTTFTENDEYYKGEGTVNYSYSDHRLKSFSYSVKGSDKYGGTYEETAKGNFTWKDGNLMQVTIEGKETGWEDGENYSEVGKLTYTYTYSSVPNVSKQFPYYVGEDITGFEETGFCVVGLFGYGPNYLPTGYMETESSTEDGKPGKQRTHTYTLTFTQNSNGTLKSEARNGSSISYTYADAPTRAEAVEAQSTEDFALSVRPSFFRHRRK